MNGEPGGDKARRVRDMFGDIAGRYDFLNHFLSANIDRRWRRTCVREIEKRHPAPNPKILDVGCGTADLAMAFARLGTVIGCDFCQPMLRIGKEKVSEAACSKRIFLAGADALVLPFADDSFDVAVSAFVFRNLADIGRGFREVRRVLKPGGLLGVLDFGMPNTPVLAPIYRFYFQKILPRIGKIVSGVEGPYGYLPDSVEKFPSLKRLEEIACDAGYADVEGLELTAGIAVLLTGRVG